MTDYLTLVFLMFFFVVPAFSFLQLKLAGEKINQVSIVNVTAVSLIMFSFIGTFVLFFQLDEYRYVTGVQDRTLVFLVLFYSSVNIIFFLIGVIFVRKFIGLNSIKYRSCDIESLESPQIIFLILMFVFCVTVLFNYLNKIDEIALIVALSGDISAANEARSSMGNSFSGDYHWYKLIMHDLGKFLTFTFFALWLKVRKSYALIMFFLTLFYSCFVSVMAIEKAPLAWLFIGLFMVYFLVRSDGVIPFRKLLYFSLVIVSMLSASYIYFMGSENLGSALWSVFSRALSGSITPAYFYLEFFPDHQDYLLGRTFPNPGGIFPYEPYRYTVEVMNWVFPSLIESGVVGTMPTVFWGETYANFGPLGIPVVAFMMGSFVALISYFVSIIQLNPLTIGFLVWLILIVKDLSITGFSIYFYNIYMIFISFAFIATVFARGYVKIRKR